jgi:hypothetical protein
VLKILLNHVTLSRYQTEQRDLQEKCSKRVPQIRDRDRHDRTGENGQMIPTGLSAKDMRSLELHRLNELNQILSNFELVEEPKNIRLLGVGCIGTFRSFDSKATTKRYLIGAFGEVNTKTSPPTISHDKVMPFIGQKKGHDAIIDSGPMKGEWELINIELNPAILSSANAA